MITIAYLAVSLSSTVLQNKKIKGVVSFILFVALYVLVSYIAYKLPHLGKNVQDRKSTRLNSSHPSRSRMPSSA